MSTIDPGMDQTISNAANDVEAGPQEGDDEQEDDEENEFRNPGRWWFASTACPLLAGTFGPLANGLSICALVYPWRVYIPPQGTQEHGQPLGDPKWLIAINAVSLLAAIVGNLSLLLNMAKRVKFSIAQPITIIGFFLAGILLIADMSALTSSRTLYLTGVAAPSASHALTSAFYYAIWAAAIYIIIGFLMCLTVHGADFSLTASQRTLMLQTMTFIAYLLFGALIFSKLEQWEYLDAVYWADLTLLTVGLGDYAPMTDTGRGLLFPFAIGGVIIIGLVVGSIRSLILQRGQEKLSTRMTEKRRSDAVHNVDERKQTVKISLFAKSAFSTDPALSPAQRREEEFNVMRKVQKEAERERRWLGLAFSVVLVLILWFGGAAVFMVCEQSQQWTYFNSLYFCYVCLLTIGYGDFHPDSNAGRSFFVLWSLMAVPSLTILISNMGDTVVRIFSDLTMWVGSVTVLPGEHGNFSTLKSMVRTVSKEMLVAISRFTPPGVFGSIPLEQGRAAHHPKRMSASEHEQRMLDRFAERLSGHVDQAELEQEARTLRSRGEVENDLNFYHYILARECRNLQKDLGSSPSKKYSWPEWEYFLKLMGNENDREDFPEQNVPDLMVPHAVRLGHSSGSDATTTASAGDGRTETSEWKELQEHHKRFRQHPDASTRREMFMSLRDWSWLSPQSPLMSRESETEWILERLSAALERELNQQRKGFKRKPPITLSDIQRRRDNKGSDEAAQEEARNVEKAARSG